MAKRAAMGRSLLDGRVIAWLESHGLSGGDCYGYEIKRYMGDFPKLIIELTLPPEIGGDPVAEVTSIDKAEQEYSSPPNDDVHWGPDHRDALGMKAGKRADCTDCNPLKKEE